jgi:hypothetical protein
VDKTETNGSTMANKKRVTMFLDEDILAWAKASTENSVVGYQTFLNNQLRVAMEGDKRVESAINFALNDAELLKQIKKTLTRAQKAVSSKKKP